MKRRRNKGKENWKGKEKNGKVELPDDMYALLDNTQYEWSDVEKKVASLGLKFVPTVKGHNSAKQYTGN